MCGLFGFSDPQHTLTQKQLRRLTSCLATESEERGTDAAGIAYMQGPNLRVYKRPKAAHLMTWLLPAKTTAVMGHTRMTTQGNPKFNANNHPFAGHCGNTRFALAHNGVLHNDISLRQQFHLPQSRIETDSYVAVQLLEKDTKFCPEAIEDMAEQLEGSFSLSLLDENNNLYLVKGNNPLAVCRFDSGLVCYASTEDILNKALHHCGFLPKQKKVIPLEQGDILCIKPDLCLQFSRFDTSNLNRGGGWWSYATTYLPSASSMYGWPGAAETPLDQLVQTACNLGFCARDVMMLLDMGYCEEEIEVLLSSPTDFYAALMDAEMYCYCDY